MQKEPNVNRSKEVPKDAKPVFVAEFRIHDDFEIQSQPTKTPTSQGQLFSAQTVQPNRGRFLLNTKHDGKGLIRRIYFRVFDLAATAAASTVAGIESLFQKSCFVSYRVLSRCNLPSSHNLHLSEVICSLSTGSRWSV